MPEILAKRWSQLTTDEFFEIVRLRTEVFFVEQRIDEPDFDTADRAPDTMHLWVADDYGCAAYLRVICLDTPVEGARWSFGRVAVRADRRGEGLAKRLLIRVLAELAGEPLVIHSQEYVTGLYARFGFIPVGMRFYEAGLPHLTMVLPAPGSSVPPGDEQVKTEPDDADDDEKEHNGQPSFKGMER